ncbi:PilZ domain-containing protein [Psychrosphaera aquimarina]|uniref:PilZ domain-containing protein n=1 Tax=Psychrosphaera aquimarina TaxID=2044854 RepID=A0ABU3R4T6_9GAMM|nr:PilZ domain-containing protein [Psychrosphaera aquimarina]MDU0114691.1 PilZ domain-containing protein [Psychrosphaera aquimarina]
MTEQDLELFSEYFQLEHQIPVNIKDGGDWDSIPTMDQFEAMIPTPYKIASEMKGLEQTMLRPLRQLGDVIEPLAEYLKAQSRKIDLMMSYILQGQDDDDLKFQASSYGGGGFVFQSEQVFTLNNWIQCKLFFNEEAAAVFCLGKIVEIETITPDEDSVSNPPQ